MVDVEYVHDPLRVIDPVANAVPAPSCPPLTSERRPERCAHAMRVGCEETTLAEVPLVVLLGALLVVCSGGRIPGRGRGPISGPFCLSGD